MLIRYESKEFRPDSRKRIEQANEIIEEYAAKGYVLTLRQLYYQFVARALIPNNNRSYKNLGTVISNGRLAGMIDWDAIVDRTRHFRSNSHWKNPKSVLESAKNSYAIDMWSNQPVHVEVWIEKEALVDVVARPCTELDVTYFACKGFVSQSAAWRAARRARQKRFEGKKIHILHLGDHDPSGLDMTRDIEDRFSTFREPVTMERLALNMDQIEELGPPPNAGKTSDARYAAYVEQYGEESWELDALDPDYINNLVETRILELRDDDLFAERTAILRNDIRILDRAIDTASDSIEDEEDEDDN